MRKSFINKLCCPFDKHDLQLQVISEEESGDIREGFMSCPECGRYYPIIYGLPIMTPDEYREKNLENPVLEKWGLEAKTGTFSFQLESDERKVLTKE